MENLLLTTPLPSGRSWTEEAPPGLHERSGGTFAADSAQKVLNIKIAGTWDNIRTAIKYIVGWSRCVSTTTGQEFNPGNPANQSPYQLQRFLPARHPKLKGLRATKILSAQGLAFDKTPGRVGGNNAGDGHVANWEYVYLSILFEIPRYPMLSDDQMTTTLHGVPVRRPEYVRFTEWRQEENVESLARKGVVWNACDPKAFAVTKTFTGDRLLRQPKAVFKITTYDMASDYVMLGRIVVTNSLRRGSTVNSLAFPQDSRRDQNKAAADANPLVQFGPGTMLLLPTKTTPRTQCHPAVLKDDIDESLFPRTVDVERSVVWFDPTTDDATTIDLSAAKYGDGVNIDAARAATPVRGHQLAPLPAPSSTGYVWYAWRNKTANPAAAAGNPANDRELLYEYSNFEALWAPVESLS